jgi:DNA-binding MurR/RpiR family transcriptional regulator
VSETPQPGLSSDRAASAATPHDVITELRRRYDELTNSQKRIAEMIVEDPEFVAFATVDKFSARLGVSPSTIVRFAYRLGFDGYPDLQDRVRELVLVNVRRNAPGADAQRDLSATLGDSVFAESLAHDIEILSRSAQQLRSEDLDAAVAALVNAEHVRVIGGVTSHSVAYHAAVTLDRVRSNVSLLPGGAQATGQTLDLSEDDVLLAFCFPPYAKSTLRTIETVREQGATVVAVTDSQISPLHGHVEVLLPVVVSGIGAQNSLVAAMAVANSLVNGVSGSSPDAIERYDRITRLLGSWDLFLLEGDAGV